MHSSAGGCGSSPAPVVRYIPSSCTVSFPCRQEPLEIVPIFATEFDIPSTDGRLTFQVDAGGNVTGVLLRVGDGQDGQEEMRRRSRQEPTSRPARR